MKILIAIITTALLTTSNFALAHNSHDKRDNHGHKLSKHRVDHHHTHRHQYSKEVCRHKSHNLTRRHTIISSSVLTPIAIHHALHDRPVKVKTIVVPVHHKHGRRYDHHDKGRHHH